MRPAQVFISYRRDDAAGYARAIYDELARRFGAERVFIDVDDIGAGQAFDRALERAVGESEVLLVLIGKRWRGERAGQPARIDEPGDFVRQEVATALAAQRRVIPLLLDGAAMPGEAELPEVLRPLARRNALEISNSRFAVDIERLVAALRDTLGEPLTATATPSAAGSAPAGRRTALRWGLAGAGLIAAGLAAWGLRHEPTRSTDAAPSPSRPAINGQWQAEVSYDWPNAHYVERFDFSGEAGELHGSASFLGVRRGLVDGSTEPGGLRFVTRTGEMLGNDTVQASHHYRGRVVGAEIHFVMQTEGGSSSHVPVEFVARRLAPAASPASR